MAYLKIQGSHKMGVSLNDTGSCICNGNYYLNILLYRYQPLCTLAGIGTAEGMLIYM